MQIHELTRPSANRKHRQVARGGKRGKTAGRGTKGQKARAGRKLRPELRDIIKKLPKRRGYRFKSIVPTRPVVVTLTALDRLPSGSVVTMKTLMEAGIIGRDSGRVPLVKILSTGAVTKPLVIKGLPLSAQARQKIEQVGGSVK